jgi:hypothetical protein
LVGFFLVVDDFLGIGAFGWRETEKGGGFLSGLLTDQVVVWRRRRRVRSGERGLKWLIHECETRRGFQRIFRKCLF